MTSIGVRTEDRRAATQPARRGTAVQHILLIAGLLSSTWYVATDLLSAARYPGYRIAHQAISELSAVGAPTSALWSVLGPVYGTLFIAFTVGVFRAARGDRPLRITAWLLAAFAAWGRLWPFFPMHQRGAELTWTDVGHVVLAAGSLILILGFTGAGARTLGRPFRAYSIATMLVVAVTGALTFAWAPRLASGEPTPWLGLTERIMIYGYLLWVAVLSVALERREADRSGRRTGRDPRPGAPVA